MSRAVIAGYARTPFVRFAGVFADVPATVLGAHAVRSALSRAGIRPDGVDVVVGGHVLQAGCGQNPARQSAVAAGIPLTTPASTVNSVCLSGTEAVIAGARLIEAGLARVVVALGQESMSRAPHMWPGSRAGQRYGSVELLDTLEHDGLTDAFAHTSMGASTAAQNSRLGIGRDEQDAWAAASHQRLAASAEFLAGEIEPFTTTGRRPVTIAADDGGRPDTTVDALAALRPAFGDEGGITAGNSSQLTDGAAAVVLTAEEACAQPLAAVTGHAIVAGPDVHLHAQPARAIAAALAGTPVARLRAVEINEAFAAVAVHSVRALGLDPTIDPGIVNAHGGAIALGHPIGASGTRIVGHLARRLAPGELGAAGICGGGGQGAAVVLEGR